MCGFFAAAGAASWVRFAVLGTLDLDERGLALIHRVWPFLWFGAAMAGAGLFYLRALRRASAFPLRHLLAGAIAMHLVAALALPLTSRDVYSNLAYARLFATGHNPYTSGPAMLAPEEPVLPLTAAQWRTTPIVYGPISTMLTVLPGAIRSLPLLLAAFKLEMLAIALLGILGAFLVCGLFPPDRAREAFVLFAWNPLFAWEVSGQAHNDGLLVLALIPFAWTATRSAAQAPSVRRLWLAALSLAAGIYAKFAAAPAFAACIVLVGRSSRRRAAAMIGAVAGAGALLFSPFWQGIGTIGAPLGTLPNHATRTTRSLADLARWIVRPSGPMAERWAYWIVAGSGIAICAWFGIRSALRARSIRDVAHDGLLFLLLYDLIGAPWFQSWYGTWLLPFALVEEDPRLRRLVAIYCVLLVVQYAIPVGQITYPLIDVFMLREVVRLLWHRAPREQPAASRPRLAYAEAPARSLTLQPQEASPP